MKNLILISFLDAPIPWQLGFQDPATPIIIGIIHFHNHLIYFLVVSFVWSLAKNLFILTSISLGLILKKHKKLVGTTISAMIDEKSKKNGQWLGRTYGDAPDVDSKVIIQENHLEIGDITNMMITGTAGYDLLGAIVNHKVAKNAKEYLK